tara:strand:- start:110306 stop:111196 length:891 start_codon:yes stop_codon:yes gene_type:complete
MNVRKWIDARRNVLVLGETGVGKSHLIRLIARENNKKFFHLNIVNLSTELIESELFGHIKGAFTGATQDKRGLCEEVEDGILFLDEIGEMKVHLQAKLLHLLEEKEFKSVGCHKVKKFKGVIVLATNCDLEAKVIEKQFRKDLLFRIQTFQLKLPPLRHREDFKEIIYNQINLMGDKLIAKNLESFLITYKWPGNFREMLSVFDYLNLCEENILTLDSLPNYIKENKTEVKENDKSYYKALELFETDYIRKSLKENEYNITVCSKKIGLSKVTLLSKIKKYNLGNFIKMSKELRMV